MQIVRLSTNFWGNPGLYNWAPVDFIEEGLIYGVRLGRPNAEDECPLDLWMGADFNGPPFNWSFFRNWMGPYIEEAEPQIYPATDVIGLVNKSDVHYASDALLLMVDLHARHEPNAVDNTNRGVFVPENQMCQTIRLSQQDHYPVGLLTIFPGFEAWLRAEGSFNKYRLLYPSAERGVYLTPLEPSNLYRGLRMTGIPPHYYGYSAFVRSEDDL